MTLVLPPRPALVEPLNVDPSALRSLAQALGAVAEDIDTGHAAVSATVESVVWTGPSSDVRTRVVDGAAADLARTRAACVRAQELVHRAATVADHACGARSSAAASLRQLQADYDRLVLAARSDPDDASTQVQALHEVVLRANRVHAQSRDQLSGFDAAMRAAAASAAEISSVLEAVARVQPSPPPAPVVPSRPKHWWEKAGHAVGEAVSSTVHGVGDAAGNAWDFTESVAQYYAENPVERSRLQVTRSRSWAVPI